jgi:hypothetical protein
VSPHIGATGVFDPRVEQAFQTLNQGRPAGAPPVPPYLEGLVKLLLSKALYWLEQAGYDLRPILWNPTLLAQAVTIAVTSPAQSGNPWMADVFE